MAGHRGKAQDIGRSQEIAGTIAPISNQMSFAIYITGFATVTAGLIYGAILMHMPAHWIVVGGMVLVSVGVLTGVKATGQKRLGALQRVNTSSLNISEFPAEGLRLFSPDEQSCSVL